MDRFFGIKFSLSSPNEEQGWGEESKSIPYRFELKTQ